MYTFKGLVSHFDKYNHAYIVFMSDYHRTPSNDDHTKKILQSYNKKFQSNLPEISSDTNMLSVKNPIKYDQYAICINHTKCYNADGKPIELQNTKTREVLITANIKSYKFYKKNKEMIVGWKINCTSLKIIK